LLASLLRRPAAAVVSGLPLFTRPLKFRLHLLADAFTLLAPEAPFIQFTYALVPPIPRSYSGAHALASERIWLNIPPARVWVYRKA
jgi:phosphatidylethanolamine/phosphatidyl-N-methylethanolamine N-methyltransferase